MNFLFFLYLLKKVIILLIPLFLAVAYSTYLERKIIAFIQLRVGPNTVGPFGLLQPFADFLKLLHKEQIFPNYSDYFLFLVAPFLMFVLSLVAWAVIPIGSNFFISDINVGVLYLMGVSSITVYSIIIAGWASNSKYSFLGSVRSAAQMISYEVSIGFIIIGVSLCSGSLNLRDIVFAQEGCWFFIPLFPLFIMFFISSLAEINRLPFDLPEAESELVSGYNVEYSSILFVFFYFAEYSNIILMSSFATLLFLGGWLPPVSIFNFVPGVVWFFFKVFFLFFIIVLVRATFPRYRYDQLMRICWKIFLPLSIFFIVLISFFLIFL